MKINFIYDKGNANINKIIDVLNFNNYLVGENNTLDFIKTGFVTHLNDDKFKVRKEGNNYYLGNSQAAFYPLKLKDISFPEDTFLSSSRDNYNISENDLFVSICTPDIYGVLAFAKFLSDNNIPYDKAKYIDMSVEYIEDDIFENNMFLIENMKNFKDKLEETLKYIENNNFDALYPRAADILKLRNSLGWTRADFARYFNIPYRTVENWEKDINDCPVYLYELIKYKIKKEKL